MAIVFDPEFACKRIRKLLKNESGSVVLGGLSTEANPREDSIQAGMLPGGEVSVSSSAVR